MTTTEMRPVTTPAIHIVGTPRLLAGVSECGRVDLAQHRQLHGQIPARTRSWLIGALGDVGMLGRGGASFPVNIKLGAVPEGRRTEVVINGSEREPASHKDRTLLTVAPHIVLDGAVVIAQALGTKHVTIVIHDAAAAHSVERAVAERADAFHILVMRTRHGFVGGEIRSVISEINGGPAVPPGRKVLPHVSGVNDSPTFASNAETFAQIAILAGRGTAEYARVGATNEPGTTLLTILGDVPYPGVCEVPLGVPLAFLLPGSSRPVLIGGYHGMWVSDVGSLPLERAVLQSHGAMLGAGVIARQPEGSCAVQDVVKVARWLATESSGQCGPCWFGLPALADDLDHLARGGGVARLAVTRKRLGIVSGRGACAHPDGAVRFIASALDVMEDDFAAHAQYATCGRPHIPFLPLPAGTP